MSELTLTALRLGLLVLLWAFVLAVVGVLRADLFGTRVSPRPTDGPAPARRQRREQRPAQPPAARNGRTLVVTEGSLRGTTLTLDGSPVLIGRGNDCTLVLDDEYASTRHVRISPAGDGWVVEDLQSTNGSHLGRERLTAPVPFEPGVPLRIGRTVLELRR
ncbi:type III secretion system (T3SS) inner membrane Yop/YscD-like protein [Kineococcus xinjiangensis]|uniref:Type III secretion system (T3SS) inner membrane Yop/YscD-like protein n=1 Tax=Kineococcus xinjiangensis TaxID=512762 RepID=A0A2S6IJ72_9ACTN|nr:FHA domain-containing protein [Kineococcus xinjiangensis]PPK94273.1 type III secretion system (T3SS) inner membrane Yop/YscD-like protein [Kineococcus xinjiangensis]